MGHCILYSNKKAGIINFNGKCLQIGASFSLLLSGQQIETIIVQRADDLVEVIHEPPTQGSTLMRARVLHCKELFACQDETDPSGVQYQQLWLP